MRGGKLGYILLGMCGTFLVLGVGTLFNTAIPWAYGVMWLVLGGGGLWLFLPSTLQEARLSAEGIEEQGLGKIVAQLPDPSAPMPDIPEDWNESVAPSQHTRMERPRFFLPPPLSAQEMIDLLAQAAQLSQRALQAASQQRIDQPLLLATHRGKGARGKVERVITSLAIWGWASWANHLQERPAPQPLSQGGYDGSPEFIDAAKQLQSALQEHPLRDNPFTLLQIRRALDRKELNAVLERPLSPQQQELAERLGQLLEEGEQKLQELLSPVR